MSDENNERGLMIAGDNPAALAAVKNIGREVGEDVGQKVSDLLAGIFAASGSLTGPVTPATALVPWVADVLLSEHSFRAYGRDLADFVEHMERLGVDPLRVSGDHVRLYKGAMLKAGLRPTTVARRLSVLRGVYRQFAEKGLVPWQVAQELETVKAPPVAKNTTPALTREQAVTRFGTEPECTKSANSRGMPTSGRQSFTTSAGRKTPNRRHGAFRFGYPDSNSRPKPLSLYTLWLNSLSQSDRPRAWKVQELSSP